MTKITRTDIDSLNAVLTIDVQDDDYRGRVDKVLKDYSKKADIKGFRKGKIPNKVISKMYGNQILAEELNKLIDEEMNKYLNENKIEILGQPLPKEGDEVNLDINKQDGYQFHYDLGLSPEIEIGKVSSKMKIQRHKIIPDKQTIQEEMDRVRIRHGKMSNPDDMEGNDILYVQLTEANKEGGYETETSVPVDFFVDALKKKLLQMKKGDSLLLDMEKSFTKSPQEVRKHVLGISDESAVETGPQFNMLLKNINRPEKAPMEQEFFDALYGPGQVDSEAAFIERFEKEFDEFLDRQADTKLENDIIDNLLKDMPIKLPNDFLKRWIQLRNESPITPEQVEKDYEIFSRDLKWSLIVNSLVKQEGLEVKPDEIEARIRETINEQFRLYPQQGVTDKMIEDYSKNMLQNKDQVKKTYDQLLERKIFGHLKTAISISEKNISLKDFNKLISHNDH